MRLPSYPSVFSLPLVELQPRRVLSPSLLIHAHRNAERLIGHVLEARRPHAERLGHLRAVPVRLTMEDLAWSLVFVLLDCFSPVIIS